jgi:hypothetical protein
VKPNVIRKGKLGQISDIVAFTDLLRVACCAEYWCPEILADDFVRRFAMRGANLMWFVGVGASASAGIPTAGDTIWDFKQRLFVTQRKVTLESVWDHSIAWCVQ